MQTRGRRKPRLSGFLALTRVGRAAGLEINDPYADEDLPYLEDDYDNEAMLDALSARDVPVFQCGNPSGMGSSSE